MTITVIGMGKIGLPLAVQFARKGRSVIGADVNPKTVEVINAGRAPFPNETHLDDYLPVEISAGRLTATTDTCGAVRESSVVVMVVPLSLNGDGQPDFSTIDAATCDVGNALQPGTLISVETTVPVGTTRKRLVPILEENSGLVAGTDFFVVFSPERVLTGRVFADLRSYPKLVGGIDSESEERGIAFYREVLDFDVRNDLPRANGVWGMGSAEAAEMAKLAETTYRDVNIALSNQFALFSERSGIDLASVIEACNSQPFSHIHTPGVAVGGHCLPVYSRLYLWNDPGASVVQAAREANSGMPGLAVERILQRVGSLEKLDVTILGAAYRGGVKETAFSGVFPLVAALRKYGARPLVHDPLYTADELHSLGFDTYSRGNRTDILILQADHPEYLEWKSQDCPGSSLILDGRGYLDPNSWEPECAYIRIGA